MGLAASALEGKDRRTAIIIGVALAVVARIVFALLTTQLLQIFGLLLAGGLLLLWVAWKMAREIWGQDQHAADGEEPALTQAPTAMRSAIFRIAVADITMSLDNVLAVAGAARDHPRALVFGLVLSVILMGVAATWTASLLRKFPWLKIAAVLLVAVVALRMMWEGGHEVWVGMQEMRGVEDAAGEPG